MSKAEGSGATNCEYCGPGFYAEQASHTCKQCEIDTYSVGGVDACIICPAGTANAKGSSSCQPCPPGTVSDGTTCVKCAKGQYAEFGGEEF